MKVVGVFLFLACVLTLILDFVPAYQAKRIGRVISFVSWPLFILWMGVILFKGFLG